MRKLKKKTEQLSRKSLFNFIESDNPSNHRRNTSKDYRGNPTVRRFLQSILFQTQRKHGANTTCIWFPQWNFYRFIDALQKLKSIGSLPWSRHWFLQRSRWSFARRFISTIFVYYLPRLITSNVNESNQRKWFFDKKKERRQSETTTNENYVDDLEQFVNTPVQAESLFHSNRKYWPLCECK